MTRARDNASIFAADGSLNISTSVNLDDNEKALFGTSDDLQIFHDGSNSIISEAGSGNLILQTNGNEIYLAGQSGNEYMLRAINNGATELYYDNAKKLATTSTGIDVTGTVTADDAAVTDTSPVLDIKGDGDGFPTFKIRRVNGVTKDDRSYYYRVTTGGDLVLVDETDSNKTRMELFDNGDISFYADDGTTQGLRWDASTSHLGIGTTSPTRQLDIVSSDDYTIARFKRSQAGGGGTIRIENGDNNYWRIGTGGDERFYFDYNGSNKHAFTHDGKVGFGTIQPNYMLHVKTTGTDYIFAETTGSSNNIGFRMKNGDTDWYLLNDANGDLDFYNATQATTPFTIVADTSFVGIGTGAPTEMLEVYRNDAVPSIKVRAHSSTTGTYYAAKLQFELSANSDATRDWDLVAEDPTDDGGHMAIRYEEDEKFRVENNGSVVVKSYVDANARPFTGTGGNDGWSKIGTISNFTQGGHTINVRIYTHAGYNARNDQDIFLDIYMKTSNASSTNSSGGSGINAWHHQIGFRESQLQVKWVANAAGVSATAYDLYVQLPTFTNGSHYEVIKRLGDWTHVGNTAQTDPGSDSTTVLASQACGSSFVGANDGLTRIRAEGSGNLRANVQQGLAKAWAKINGTGTPAIDDTYNISSVTDVNTGSRTIAINNDMNNSNHCVTTACMGDRVSLIGAASDDTYSASTVQYRNNDSRNANFVDTTRENLTIHGDLA